jgi:hypothetical protein
VNNGYIQGIYPAYRVKPGDRFRSTIGCEGGATSCYVIFRLDYAVAGSNAIQTLSAFAERYEGMNLNADVDLTPLVNQDIKFILTILSAGSPVGDRAIWIAPMIYNLAAGAPATPVSPAPNTPTTTMIPSVAPTISYPTVTMTPAVTPTATP